MKKRKLYKKLLILLVLIYAIFTLVNQQKVINQYTSNSKELASKIEEQENYKKELVAEKDKKLAQIITEKENAISKLVSEIHDIQNRYSLSSMSDAYLVLKNSSIYKKIQCIEAHPLEEMNEEDWTELADTVEELIPNFIPMLKNRVSDRDYRICLLIRLGIPASLMARLLNLSDAAISKSRKTMLKKLCGKVGKPKEFDEYVLHIP